MKNSTYTKYISALFLLVALIACNEEEDVLEEYGITGNEVVLPELTNGTADFSTTVAVGASFTAGFTDNALFVASQENSFPKILSDQFAKIGGGTFTQPLTSDNFGGLALGGTRIADPRLVFDGAGPASLEALIGPVTVTTDIALNNPSGPFNNMGVPGALSFHLVTPGYGDINGVGVYANPYFVRMASSPTATVLEDALAQNPTFFTTSLIGANDVLGYAIGGGTAVDQTGNPDPTTYGSGDITDPTLFAGTFQNIIGALMANGAKGVVSNIPYITSLPYFTTVPYAPLSPADPNFGPLIGDLNAVFGALNPVYDILGVPERKIVFSTSAASAVVIKDETLTDLTQAMAQVLMMDPTFPAFIAQFGLPPEAAPTVAGLLGTLYGQSRHAEPSDLLVLPSSSVIGQINTDFAASLVAQGVPVTTAAQFAVEGVTLPLEDKWVLTADEQATVITATDAYNATIEGLAASSADLALVDLKSILNALATTGVTFGEFSFNSDLVLGGAISLDGVHLTSRGYSYMAYEYLKAIDENFGSNFIESGNFPNPGDFPTNYSATLQ